MHIEQMHSAALPTRTLLQRLKPLRFDLYVLSEVSWPFMGGILFFCFVFLMFQALRLSDFFIIHGVAGSVLLKMSGLLILSFMPYALPIAFLIGVLVAFGRLSADSELIAMKAHGVSVARLAFTIFLLSMGVTILSLGLNLNWVPWGDREFKGTLIKVSNTKVVTSIREGTFTSGFFDLLLYVDHVDPITKHLKKVFIYDEREANNPVTVVAREGEIVRVKTEKELSSAIMMKLYDGSIHSAASGKDAYQKIDFQEYRLFLKIDEGIDNATLKPRMMPYGDLVHSIDTITPGTPMYLELRAEYWRRFSIAYSPLLFVFLGIGYGTVRTRAARAGAILITLGVVLIYWTVQVVSMVVSQKGWVHPALALQVPNAVVGLLAIKGFRTASW